MKINRSICILFICMLMSCTQIKHVNSQYFPVDTQNPKIHISPEDINDSPKLGKDSAPVKIIFFYSYECPFSLKVDAYLNQIYTYNQNDIQIVYRRLPLKISAQNTSEFSSLASLIAFRQGKFEDVHIALFENQAELSTDKIEQILSKNNVKFSKNSFSNIDDKVKIIIEKDKALISKWDLMSTPFIIVNGIVIPGAYPVNIIQEAINSAKTSHQWNNLTGAGIS